MTAAPLAAPDGHGPWPPRWTVAPIARGAGELRLPGSKSLSNRALLLAALAEGSTRLTGLLDADDTRVMIAALRQLGIDVQPEGEAMRVQGCGGRIPARRAELHLGNAGTAMRPLAAALAFAGGHYRLDGVARMRERPIGDLVDALRAAGARVHYLGLEGYPPLAIEPAGPALAPGGRLRVRGDVSSQFLSGLLMAAPGFAPPQGVCIEVEGPLISQPYVAMTVAMMGRFGAAVQAGPGRYEVQPGGYRAPGDYPIEGDASGASYFLALGAIAGGPVRVGGVGRGSLQGDLAFTRVLEAMGARVELGADWVQAAGAPGQRFPLRAIEFDATEIPDAAMTAAVLALFARGTTRLRGIGSWRVKETDRIEAMACELAKLGAQVQSGPDWIAVTAPEVLREAEVDTYDDHRMAMCLALAAAGGVPVHVRDPGCVAKTFPEYFAELARLAVPAADAGAGR
jgi:3-phosphoshikimate 1-carboxyvinyltransferase